MNDAYAAGLVDGEGTIYIDKRYCVRLEIQMSVRARRILRALETDYGGTVKLARPATEKWDETWRWTQFSDLAATTLRRLEPLLRLKDEQARLGIAVTELRSQKPKNQEWPPELRERADRLRLRVRELNRRGPRGVPQDGAAPIALRVAGDWVTPQSDLFSDLGYETFSGRWPTSGMASPGACWTQDMPECPSGAVECSLSDVLEATPGPRYALSARAARGILRRASARGRGLPAEIEAALATLAATMPPVSPRTSDGTSTPKRSSSAPPSEAIRGPDPTRTGTLW